jgi:hypothetical protein
LPQTPTDRQERGEFDLRLLRAVLSTSLFRRRYVSRRFADRYAAVVSGKSQIRASSDRTLKASPAALHALFQSFSKFVFNLSPISARCKRECGALR